MAWHRMIRVSSVEWDLYETGGAMMAHQIGVVAAAASGANSLALSEDEEGGRSRRWGSRKGERKE